MIGGQWIRNAALNRLRSSIRHIELERSVDYAYRMRGEWKIFMTSAGGRMLIRRLHKNYWVVKKVWNGFSALRWEFLQPLNRDSCAPIKGFEAFYDVWDFRARRTLWCGSRCSLFVVDEKLFPGTEVRNFINSWTPDDEIDMIEIQHALASGEKSSRIRCIGRASRWGEHEVAKCETMSFSFR